MKKEETIVVTYKEIKDVYFKSGFKKIVECLEFSKKLDYHISRIHKLITSFEEDGDTVYNKLVTKYAKKGEMKILEKNLDAFKKEEKEVHALSNDIEKFKIDFNDLDEIKFSPAELAGIEPLVKGMVEEKKLKAVKK